MDDHKIIFHQMMSIKKLDRDRGLLELQRHLETIDPDTYMALTAFVVEKSKSSTCELLGQSDGVNEADQQKSETNNSMDTDSAPSHWEYYHAVLSAFKVIPIIIIGNLTKKVEESNDEDQTNL